MILDTLNWRIDFPLPFVDKNLLKVELTTGKHFVHGKTKAGNPVVYICPGKENTWDAKSNVISLVYTIERAAQSMDDHCMDLVCIVDCAGVGVMTAPSTAFIREVVDVLGKHMPRRLGKMFVCNVSSIFYFLWNVISTTLSEMTLQKIQILNDSKESMKAAIGKYKFKTLFKIKYM